MENKFINRYNTFCKSLKSLEKSCTADPKADFVLEATVLNFNLTFDISWKNHERYFGEAIRGS